ncbi:hypothetical protein PINS_up012999 [Pythium insidiosum]|nr:hypothetical protein PINS_up012999 [Pythium insidiosum]
MIMRTQKFKGHFQARHLSPGQRYETRHCDEFERALLGPDLLDLADDGPLKALMVASVARIAHYLDVLTARLPPQDGEDGDGTTNNGSVGDEDQGDGGGNNDDDGDGGRDGGGDGVVEESQADEEPALRPSTRAQKRASEKPRPERATKTRKK